MPKKEARDSGARRGNGSSGDLDLKRLTDLVNDQVAAESEQDGSDADQTASDRDQTASDADRELSVRDQRAADRDQQASDRDQAASDRDLDQVHEPETQSAHDAGLVDRQKGSKERKGTQHARDATADQRAAVAAGRDESAWHRDLTAQARDGAADRRDRDSAKLERKMGSRGSSLRAALTHASEVRAQAAKDRVRAAEDRAQAARDRERAAAERAEVLAELKRAHLDELTGALRRGAGEHALQAEIDRARRSDVGLVMAYIDVDSLREVNNRDGHSSGDDLLRAVVASIRSKIRSYEPIVRFGGDEFVCVISNLGLDLAEQRIKEIQDTLIAQRSDAAISVGLAEMRPEDTLDELLDRADNALLDARRRGAD